MGLNAFPSSASNVPVEVFELKSPSMVRAKDFIEGSPGAGRYRGAPGQKLLVSKLPSHPYPLDFYLFPKRTKYPVQGLFAGHDGIKTRVIHNGTVLSDDPALMKEGIVTLESADDWLALEWPSGGGIHNPADRDRAAVLDDLRDGLITSNQARNLYGLDPVDPSTGSG